ncbi:hypothetical protein F0261_19500 [Alteromonas sp. 07-89-2]|uniref:hypothetical protein n=1 Tax=Alteromonas sp. 07-89-2 TaxID=2607609 RepID=UPI00148E3C3D|nr:hypothetical protein [Alteromonas sp. 07-89-2]NOH60213.1 hypothetical protein [Alteromonas sp. 07-89-2]
MSLKPFPNIKPRNLGLLLFMARMLTYFGVVLIGIAIAIIAATLFNYLFSTPPISGSTEIYSNGLNGIKGGFLIIAAGLFVIVLSNIFAAIVSWESSLSSEKHNGT